VSFLIWRHEWDHIRDADLMKVESFGSPELFNYETMVMSVERFVEKRDAKVPAGVGIFRDSRFRTPIFIEPSLAKEIEANGFEGFFFEPTEAE